MPVICQLTVVFRPGRRQSHLGLEPCRMGLPFLRHDYPFLGQPTVAYSTVQFLGYWVQTLEPDKKRTPRERIMQSIKRHSAKECNERRGVQGRFWQQESYDHWVREVAELERIINYIEYNPVKAGLVSDAKVWPFGSARFRAALGLGLGTPLTKAHVG